MMKRLVPMTFSNHVCTARGMQTASSCPCASSRKKNGACARTALMDTMLMVSIFVFLILPGLIWAIRLSILAAIILLVIRLGLQSIPIVPNEQPLSAA